MQWRVVVELSGTAGAVPLHEVHVGGSPMTGCSAATLGLTLVEAKLVLAGLQRRLVQAQTEERCQARRCCPRCGGQRPLKDRRARRLRSLLGVALQLVRSDHTRYILQALQQLSKEPFGWLHIASALHKYVEHVPILIERPSDETYTKIHGKWKYLYRAVDRDGDTVNFVHGSPRSGGGELCDLLRSRRHHNQTISASSCRSRFSKGGRIALHIVTNT
jgi:hypothetical protein